MEQTPIATGAATDPIDDLNLAVQQFHAAVDAAQNAGWNVTVTTPSEKSASTSIKVAVTRRIGREEK